MSGRGNAGHEPFRPLVQWMVDDIVEASDEEIIAEYREEGGDPDKLAAEMCKRLEKEEIKARKGRPLRRSKG